MRTFSTAARQMRRCREASRAFPCVSCCAGVMAKTVFRAENHTTVLTPALRRPGRPPATRCGEACPGEVISSHHRREALPNERVHKNDTIVPASYSCTRVRARLSAARSLSSSRSHPRATTTGTALSRARQKALRSTPHGALAAGPPRLVCWPRASVTALTLTGVRAEPTTCPRAPWVQSGGKARFGSQRPCSHEGHGHDPLPRPRPTGPRRLPPFPHVRRGR